MAIIDFDLWDYWSFCAIFGSGDVSLPATETEVFCRTTEPHYVEIHMDGVRVAGPTLMTANSERSFTIYIPNDGRDHQIKALDRGDQGTNPTETNFIQWGSDCGGVVLFEVYNVDKNAVDVKITHGGDDSATYTCRLLLDGQAVGGEIQVGPGGEQTRRVLVPPDGQRHVVKGEVRVGSQWATGIPCLWYTIATTEGGGTGPGPGEPPPTEPATEFRPGETIIVQSEGATPLATDGSEWVLVEISPRGQDQWEPIGPDAGLVSPDEDGNWTFAIETDGDSRFVPGTQWDLRARRFRNYQPSLPSIHYFDIVEGAPGGVDLEVPVITGPWWDQLSGQWVQMRGTGTPGSVVEFDAELVTPWGRPEQPPKSTTVSKNGKWTTYIYAEHWGGWDSPGYKVVAYRARAKFHGQVTAWSEPHEVYWVSPIR